jgi:hypothetical protein
MRSISLAIETEELARFPVPASEKHFANWADRASPELFGLVSFRNLDSSAPSGALSCPNSLPLRKTHPLTVQARDAAEGHNISSPM